MPRNNETVTVKILDKEYQVSCTRDERTALLEASTELDQRMRDVRKSGSVIGSERISVMVALNLSHELLKARQSLPAEQDQAMLQAIHEKIDGVV